MYRNEHQGQNIAVGAAVKDGVLASHRSLPDHERSGVARAVDERESVTEWRGKKKKKCKHRMDRGGGGGGESSRPGQQLPRLPQR